MVKSIFVFLDSDLILKTGFQPEMFSKSSSQDIFFYCHIPALESLGLFCGQSNSLSDEQEGQDNLWRNLQLMTNAMGMSPK